MLRRDTQVPRDLAVIGPKLLEPPEILNVRAKMKAQIETSPQKRRYSNWNNLVKEKIPYGVYDPLRERVATAFKELRASLGFSQEQMGIALSVSQGQIAKWEGGKQTPPGQAFAAIARLASNEDKHFWLELAGLNRGEVAERATDIISIPLLRDPAAAGTPRAVDEREVAEHINLPKGWLPRGGKFFALRVKGDSMSPILLDGHIVIVDVAHHNATKLVQHMVAARDADGVTIKWLRCTGEIYSLVPQHVAPEFEVQYLHPLGDFTVIGDVVMWIGTPPPARRK